jgi:hypothetical protein
MILNNIISVKTTNKNISYYKNKGYIINSGDIINIPPNILPKGSHYIINVSCDTCNQIKKLQYRTYYNLTNELTQKYYCNKCKTIKTKNTCIEKYGVDNVFKNIEIKNKIKKIMIRKYGVTSYLKLLKNDHNKNHEKLKKTTSLKYKKLFIEKIKSIHGDKYQYLSPYINMNTKIKILCPFHGEFEQRPKDHINNKQGCSICKKSKGEKIIHNFLNTNNINFESQKNLKVALIKGNYLLIFIYLITIYV